MADHITLARTAAPARRSRFGWLGRRPVAMLCAAGTLAGAAGLLAAPAAQAGPAASTVTLTLISVTKTMARVPTGGVEVDVDKTTKGKVIGADTLICQVTKRGAPVSCVATVSLSKGALFGAVKPTRSGAAGKVTGGTGRYAGYTGTISAKNLSQVKTRVVIKLHKK